MLGTYQVVPSVPKCGINFSMGSPDTFSLIRPMGMWTCNATFCDSSGSLFCYSNGIYIGNKQQDTLLNAKNFNPGSYTNASQTKGLDWVQGVLFLPSPNHPNQIITFNESGEATQIDSVNKWAPSSLKYSVIDMNLDSGRGAIIPSKKAVTIVNDTLIGGFITASKHGNGRDWWVLVQKANTGLFYKLLITPDTIEVFTQQIGSNIIYDFSGNAMFSADGSKYILVTQYLSIDIFDFDRCSGTLSNHHHITAQDSTLGTTGASISPSNRWLYVSNQKRIYQYDLWSSNIDSTVQVVAVFDSFVSPFQTLFSLHQLGPDGKIYISTWDACNVLHIIGQPDSGGIACNILQHNLNLPLYNLSVPNNPNYNLGRLQGSPCDTLQWTGSPPTPEGGVSNFKIYPNPVTDNVLNIGYQLPVSASSTSLSGIFQIYDVTGKVVFRYVLPQWSHLQMFNLPQLSDGVYSCVITSGGYRVSKRLVVIKE